MTTYADLKLERHLAESFGYVDDDFILEKPEDFKNLFYCLYSVEDWAAISALLEHPSSDCLKETPNTIHGLRVEFFLSLKNPEYLSEAHLGKFTDSEKLLLNSHEHCLCLLYLRSGLSGINFLLQTMPDLEPESLEIARRAQMDTFYWAAKYDYPELLERMLGLEYVKRRAHENHNIALFWASVKGHIAVVEHLLTLPAISSRADAKNNQALRYASRGRHYKVIIRLLQEPNVRHKVVLHKSQIDYDILINGLKCALWLDLQQTKDFEEINSLADLQDLATGYLRDHPDWLPTSFHKTEREALIKNTCLQVLGLGYYKPFMSSNLLLAEHWELADDFVFLALPQTLAHFQEAQFIQAKSLAYRCLRTRQEALHATQALNLAPLALTSAITRRLA